MHKAIQVILLVVGVFLIWYGLYTMITPEATVDLGIVEAEIQDNNNAYVNIGFGIAAIVLSLLASRRR
jgi:divalent metal cation (Fe/Co/Zn/Cd) transporter